MVKRIELTRDQKEGLALMLWSVAGDWVEDWDAAIAKGRVPLILQEVDPELIAETLSRWLGKLPAREYDIRLPDPDQLG